VSAGGMRSTGIKGLTFRVNQCRVHNTNAAIPHCSPDFGHKHVHVALPASATRHAGGFRSAKQTNSAT
jgi:hypothetical protein